MQRLLPDNTHHSQQTNIHAPVGCEPAIPASGGPQTHALYRAAAGLGIYKYNYKKLTDVFIRQPVEGSMED